MVNAYAHQRCAVILVVLASVVCVRTVSAQASDARQSILAPAPGRPGDILFVTDTSGVTLKGTLQELKADELHFMVEGMRKRMPLAKVRWIQRQQRDSIWTGVLIGAGIGAIPGLYWLVADPNECTGMCPEEYALIAAGAVVGGLIDHAIQRKVIIYSADPASTNATRVVLAPLVTRARRGLQIALRF